MSTNKLLAGVSLAALGAAGLTMLSTPAFASPVANWYTVPACPAVSPTTSGFTDCGPAYKTEGTGTLMATMPPEYAEQAINSGGSTLTIPGYGSGSPYGGFTWFDPGFGPTSSGGGTALITFTMPAGETINSIGSTTCPGTVFGNSSGTTPVGGVDGTRFVQIQALSCTTNSMTATVVTNTSAGTGAAWYQLPAFKLNVNAALIANLGSPTANGGTTATLGGNCETLTGNNAASCDVTTSASEALSGSPSGVLATSQNVLSLRTFNNSELICIDVLEDQQPGTRFQQPCDGSHAGTTGSIGTYASGDSNGQFTNANGGPANGNALSPTKVDGTTNGAPESGVVNNQVCMDATGAAGSGLNVYYTSTPADPSPVTIECGNGSVTGTITSERDILVADKGTIEINVTELLALDGIHIYQWLGGSVQNPTITIVGLCAGLEGPIENIGSVPCVGGIKPFTGETTDSLGNVGYVALTPLKSTSGLLTGLNGFNTPSPNLTGVTQFCPKEDDIVGSINFSVPGNGSTATFTGTQLVLQDIPNGTVLTTTAYTTLPSYYEFCDYANGTSVLGPVSQFYVTVSVDVGFKDVTVLTDNPTGVSKVGTSTAVIGSQPVVQPADALLVYEYNGIGQLFQFTNGGTNYSAYLRVVNLMEDYVACPVPGPSTGNCATSSEAITSGPGSPGCVTVDPNGTCEPAGAVVCKVWGDDGQNAFVTLWPSQGTVDGQLSGTNAMYSVASLFTQAGITASNANPFDLGAMLCFHNQRIHLSQFWIEPNGSIVNLQ